MRKIFLLVGKSSVGKTVIEKELGKKGIHRAISFTSRPPRITEREGDEYFFVSNSDINRMKDDGKLYELTKYKVGGELWQYSLTKESFKTGVINVATVNPDGMKQLLKIKELSDKMFIINITAPLDVCKKRYLEREKKSEKSLKNWEERVLQDHKDFDLDKPFEGLTNVINVVNDGSKTIEEMGNIVYEIIERSNRDEF